MSGEGKRSVDSTKRRSVHPYFTRRISRARSLHDGVRAEIHPRGVTTLGTRVPSTPWPAPRGLSIVTGGGAPVSRVSRKRWQPARREADAATCSTASRVRMLDKGATKQGRTVVVALEHSSQHHRVEREREREREAWRVWRSVAWRVARLGVAWRGVARFYLVPWRAVLHRVRVPRLSLSRFVTRSARRCVVALCVGRASR